MARRSNLNRIIKLPLPCPHCGKEGMEPVARLVGYDELPCSLCGKAIDLRSEEWQAYVHEIAKAFSQIRPAYQKLP